MANENYSENESRLIWFLGQIIVLTLCVGYAFYFYTQNILPDMQVKESFQNTNCLLMSKRLITRGLLLSRYRAEFLISYNVNNVQYSRWVSGNGLDSSFNRPRKEQEAILRQFDVGSAYTCYYNPNDPEVSIIVERHNWFTAYPIFIPIIIGLFALFYILKNILIFFGVIQRKM